MAESSEKKLALVTGLVWQRPDGTQWRIVGFDKTDVLFEGPLPETKARLNVPQRVVLHDWQWAPRSDPG